MDFDERMEIPSKEEPLPPEAGRVVRCGEFLLWEGIQVTGFLLSCFQSAEKLGVRALWNRDCDRLHLIGSRTGGGPDGDHS